MPLAATKLPVAVLGGGLSGMSAGLELSELGVDATVFEKRDRPGGLAVTTQERGYRFDQTGHLLHLRDPSMRARVLQWLGDSATQVKRRSVVWSNGVYTRYPFQANTFGLPPSVAFECVMGFLKAAEAKQKGAPKNFRQYCEQHFGAGFTTHFMLPYNEKMWGTSLSDITAEWCQRFVPIPSREDVIAGAVGQTGRELGYNTEFTYPRDGVGTLSERMAQELTTLELSRAPTAVDLKERVLEFGDDRIRFEALVSSVPLTALLRLVKALPPAVRDASRKLRSTHLYYLDIALRAPCPHNYHWVYVPETRYPFYRVGCYSHFSASMAPEGCAALYVELAQRSEPELESLLPAVARDLAAMRFIEREADILFARLRKIDVAYVVFDHEYYGAMGIILDYLKSERVIPAGRYGAWHYSSMEDALISGREAALEARKLLG